MKIQNVKLKLECLLNPRNWGESKETDIFNWPVYLVGEQCLTRLWINCSGLPWKINLDFFTMNFKLWISTVEFESTEYSKIFPRK